MIEQIVSFALPLLYLLGSTASLVFLTKRSFGKCLPLAMMGSAFLLFFSQLLFGTFDVGFVVGVVFATASLGLGMWKRKEWGEYKRMLFTSGLVAFLVIYVLVFIYDLARGFAVWDEFSHWGMMLKEMVRLDKFYSVEASNLMVHKDYPPIMQLFELFWIKLCGGFSEAYAERALHTFELSFVVPFIAEKVIRKKAVMKEFLVAICAGALIVCGIIMFDEHIVFHTIYNDYVMAVVVAYLLATALMSDTMTWFEIMVLSVGGGFLLLLKQMGMPLYLMSIVFYIGVTLTRGRKKVEKEKLSLQKKACIVVALIMPFVWYFVWGRITSGVAKQFSLSDMNMFEFINILRGQGEEWQTLTVQNYMMAIGRTNISTSFILMSYLQGVLTFSVLLWGIYELFKKNLEKRKVIILEVVLVIGAVLYGVAMLLLYTMSFSSYEGLALASFERYMGTYLIIMVVVEVMILVKMATELSRIKTLAVVAVAMVVLTAPAMPLRLRPIIHNNSEMRYANYIRDAETINEATGGEGKVFLVAQNTLGYFYYLQYFATPNKLNNEFYAWPVGNGDTKNYYNNIIKPEMVKYDYVLFAEINDEYRKDYCEVLKVCPNQNGEIYEIIKAGDEIVGFRKL